MNVSKDHDLKLAGFGCSLMLAWNNMMGRLMRHDFFILSALTTRAYTHES